MRKTLLLVSVFIFLVSFLIASQLHEDDKMETKNQVLVVINEKDSTITSSVLDYLKTIDEKKIESIIVINDSVFIRKMNVPDVKAVVKNELSDQ